VLYTADILPSRSRHLIQETGLVCISSGISGKEPWVSAALPPASLTAILAIILIDGRYLPLMLHHGIPGVDGNEYIGRPASYARRRRRRWLDLSMAFFKQRYSIPIYLVGPSIICGAYRHFYFRPKLRILHERPAFFLSSLSRAHLLLSVS
jgi:hypothetical protein